MTTFGDTMKPEEFEKKWGRDGKSLLLYLESRAVDHAGLVDVRRMNDIDRVIAEKMVEAGILSHYCRLPAHYIMDNKKINVAEGCSMFVELTAKGWELAHIFRKSRAVLGTEERKKVLKEKYEWVIR